MSFVSVPVFNILTLCSFYFGFVHGLFETLTTDIPGLTANSMIATTLSGGVKTDVPIWIETDPNGKPVIGNGIIILPLNASQPGEVAIPPPPGYPSLVIVDILSTASAAATTSSPTPSPTGSALPLLSSSFSRPSFSLSADISIPVPLLTSLLRINTSLLSINSTSPPSVVGYPSSSPLSSENNISTPTAWTYIPPSVLSTSSGSSNSPFSTSIRPASSLESSITPSNVSSSSASGNSTSQLYFPTSASIIPFASPSSASSEGSLPLSSLTSSHALPSPSSLASRSTSPLASSFLAAVSNDAAASGGAAGGAGLLGGIGGALGSSDTGAGAGAGSGSGVEGSGDGESNNNEKKPSSAPLPSSSLDLSISQRPSSSLQVTSSSTATTSSVASSSSSSFSTSSSVRSSTRSANSTVTSAPSITSASITSTSSCFSYNFDHPDLLTKSSDDGDTVGKRAIAGRIRFDRRAKSGKDVTDQIGSCSVATYTVKPAYPGPAVIISNENRIRQSSSPASNMVKFFSTATYWAVPTSTSCGAPTWTIKDTAAVTSLGMVPGKDLNVDHVYEKQTLQEFFVAAIGPGDCDDIAALFDQNADPNNRANTLLSSVFAQIATYENPYFLGMSSSLNSMKAHLWAPEAPKGGLRDMPQWSPRKGSQVAFNINQLNEISIVMDISQNDNHFGLWWKTNELIYQAFQGVDKFLDYQSSLSVPITNTKNGATLSSTWAARYTDYATSKISAQNALITAHCSSLSSAIAASAVAQSDKDALFAWNTKYNLAQLTFRSDFTYSPAPLDFYLAGQSPPPCKRDGSACSIGSNTASPTTHPASPPAIPVPAPASAPQIPTSSPTTAPSLSSFSPPSSVASPSLVSIPSSQPGPLSIMSINLLVNTIAAENPTTTSQGIAPSNFKILPNGISMVDTELIPENGLDAVAYSGNDPCLATDGSGYTC